MNLPRFKLHSRCQCIDCQRQEAERLQRRHRKQIQDFCADCRRSIADLRRQPGRTTALIIDSYQSALDEAERQLRSL